MSDEQPLPFLDSDCSEEPQPTTRTGQSQQSTAASSSASPSLLEDTPMKSSSNGGENGYRNVSEEEDAVEAELGDSIFEQETMAERIFAGKVASDSDIDAFLEECDQYDYQTKRWSVPNTKKEADLYDPLMSVIESILDHFGYTNDDKRTIHNTHRKKIPHEVVGEGKRLSTSPDFLVTGTGKNFPREEAKEDKPLAYAHCVSPIEIKTEANRSFKSDLWQIGVYARQCFVSQRNRFYVLCPIITQSHLQLFIFHRSGVHHSLRINFHEEACAFVRIILGVCSIDDELVGFDTRIYYDSQGQRFMRTVNKKNKPVKYPLAEFEALFMRRTIKGRGTCCWSVKKRDKSLLVKDSWRHPSRPSEIGYLKQLVNLEGVVQLVAYEQEEMKISDFPVFEWMSEDDRKAFRKQDRAFTRITIKWSGRGLSKFETGLEILTALRDAIAGHRNMLNSGILHRDVSINNIVIGKRRHKSRVGKRGVLIDLDMAIFVKRLKSLIGQDFRTGTRAFQSANVLYSYGTGTFSRPHSHLDDLESFFHVLCWICFKYVRPGQKLPNIPQILSFWDHEDHRIAYMAKKTFFSDPLTDRKTGVVSDFFGAPFRKLLENLHAFFRPYACELLAAPPPLTTILSTSEEDYKTVLAMFDEAIAQVAGLSTSPGLPIPSPAAPVTPRRHAPPPPPPPPPQAGPSRVSHTSKNSSSSRKRGSAEVDHVVDPADSPKLKRQRNSYKPKTPSSLSQSIGPSQEDDNEDDE
ncbi:hypothetical protein NLJ89_g7794 [Agrocybe chaxingu]|uniref:Fungal-type protein kinase domain-containing protein n=1 Tax=Agrocybe chaxingu TaxID=84603 RepID=A0A9W8MUQ3_9AGAR|nr:hypothetical protein NLJ89_g7794 [Agrocybe chaxingu]